MAWVPPSPFGEPGWAARPGPPGRTLPKSHTPGAFVFSAGGPPDQGQEPQANVSNSRSALSLPSVSLPAWGGRPPPGTLPTPSRSVLSEPRTLPIPLNRPPSPTLGPAAAARSRALLFKCLPDASAHSQSARPRTPPGHLLSPSMKSNFCSRADGRDRPRLPPGVICTPLPPSVLSNPDPQFLERAVTSGVLPMLPPLLCLLSPGHFLCTFQTLFLGSFPTLTG